MNRQTAWIQIIIWLGFLGLITFGFGSLGLLSRPVAIILLIGFMCKIVGYTKKIITTSPPLSKPEKLLLSLVGIQLALNSLGIFVPELSFDALWYHLPEASVYAATGQIAPIPELLYSTMSRLGEMYFTLALIIGPLGLVKVVTFLFSILFLFSSYLIARYILSRPQSLLVVLILNSFPLVAWQSTAAYVDLIAATFQLTAFLCLLGFFNQPVNQLTNYRQFWYSAILIGFALSVKMQSIIFLVAISAFLLISFKKTGYSNSKILFLISYFIFLSLAAAFPWYWSNYQASGHPLYPLNLPAKRLDQLTYSGAISLPDWILRQTLTLPLVPLKLGTSYTFQLSPLLTILFPLLLFQLKKLIHIPLLKFSLIYCLLPLVLWYFLPPPESRYLLGALPILVITLIKAVVFLPREFLYLKNLSLVACGLSLIITFAIRLAASAKYFPLFTGRITAQEYITSQTTDFNRGIITKFYSGYWSHFQYPTLIPPHTPQSLPPSVVPANF